MTLCAGHVDCPEKSDYTICRDCCPVIRVGIIMQVVDARWTYVTPGHEEKAWFCRGEQSVTLCMPAGKSAGQPQCADTSDNFDTPVADPQNMRWSDEGPNANTDQSVCDQGNRHPPAHRIGSVTCAACKPQHARIQILHRLSNETHILHRFKP